MIKKINNSYTEAVVPIRKIVSTKKRIEINLILYGCIHLIVLIFYNYLNISSCVFISAKIYLSFRELNLMIGESKTILLTA